MQRAQPKLVEIRRRWASDPEKMNKETARLYVEEGINPFAGFVPALIQIPVFISLYRSILQLSETDPHFSEGFLWIPSLSGPLTEG
jgi:YidC/Oxa1 family membrane protein insertase